MERKLAHIEKVEWVKPINGADNIELIGVLGWTCIAKKGEFKEDDVALYIEIDSKVPDTDERFAFLSSKHYKVKTMKLSKFGVISQGLALPITLFPELSEKCIGDDATKDLNIIYSVEEDNIRKSGQSNPEAKYKAMAARNPELFRKPIVRKIMKYDIGRKIMFLIFGNKNDKPLEFPTHFDFIHKTDEERVENMPWVLKNKNPLRVTEKLDGTSSTYILEKKGKNKFEFYVLSRNVRQMTPNQKTYHKDNIYWNMAFKYGIEAHLKKYLEENSVLKYVCIQGESVGSVQKNPLKLKEDQLFVFNFIDSEHGRIDSEIAKPLIESWGMQWVPVLDTSYIMPDSMEEFKQYATAKSVVNPSVYREGVVLRDYTTGLSFKNVSREYLLKHGD